MSYALIFVTLWSDVAQRSMITLRRQCLWELNQLCSRVEVVRTRDLYRSPISTASSLMPAASLWNGGTPGKHKEVSLIHDRRHGFVTPKRM